MNEIRIRVCLSVSFSIGTSSRGKEEKRRCHRIEKLAPVRRRWHGCAYDDSPSDDLNALRRAAAFPSLYGLFLFVAWFFLRAGKSIFPFEDSYSLRYLCVSISLLLPPALSSSDVPPLKIIFVSKIWDMGRLLWQGGALLQRPLAAREELERGDIVTAVNCMQSAIHLWRIGAHLFSFGYFWCGILFISVSASVGRFFFVCLFVCLIKSNHSYMGHLSDAVSLRQLCVLPDSQELISSLTFISSLHLCISFYIYIYI
eukprot:gene1394-817_t